MALFEKGAHNENGALQTDAQRIITRKMGMPVEVQIAGKTYNLKPGSAYTLNMVQRIVEETRMNMLNVWMGDKRGRALIEKAQNLDAVADKTGLLGEPLEVTKLMADISDIRKKAEEIQMQGIFRTIQLILLDNEDPGWKFNYKGLPPKSVLESVISSETLEKTATIEEITNLLHVYFQLNTLEKAREDFLNLGAAMP